MHRIEKVINTIIRLKHHCYFITDTSNGYWVVQIKPGDKYKTSFITLYGQYVYLQISQDLISAFHTYSQFSNMLFGHLCKTANISAQLTLVRNHGD